MTPKLQTRPDAEPQSNRTASRTPTPADATAIAAEPRTATDLAPKTFSPTNTARLQNLVDEFNAAFAKRAAESASGS